MSHRRNPFTQRISKCVGKELDVLVSCSASENNSTLCCRQFFSKISSAEVLERTRIASEKNSNKKQEVDVRMKITRCCVDVYYLIYAPERRDTVAASSAL